MYLNVCTMETYVNIDNNLQEFDWIFDRRYFITCHDPSWSFNTLKPLMVIDESFELVELVATVAAIEIVFTLNTKRIC